MADWYAAGEIDGPGYLGSPEQFIAWPDRARPVLYRNGLHGAFARIHEEDTKDAKAGL